MPGILILAHGKTGTTILFEKLRRALPADTVCLFEPTDCAPPQPVAAAGRFVLSKVLFSQHRAVDDYGPQACSYFDRRIYIRRDPRDMLVSHLLYSSYHLQITSRFDAFIEFVSALKAKQQDPRSVTFMELADLQERLKKKVAPRWARATVDRLVIRNLRFGARVVAAHGSAMFTLDYEDLVDGRLDALEQYLGLKLHPTRDVAPEYGRVARTKSYGDWRNWFTPEDVAFLRPKLAEFGDLLRDDWELPAEPRISVASSTSYVERLARDRGCFTRFQYDPELIPATARLLGHPRGGRQPCYLEGLRPPSTEVHPIRGAEIHDPHFETPDGRRVNVLIQGQHYVGTYRASLAARTSDLSFWMWIVDASGQVVRRMGTALDGIDLGSLDVPGDVRVEFEFACNLAPEVYFVQVAATSGNEEAPVEFLHRIDNALAIVVAEGPQPRLRVIPLAPT